MFCHKSFHKILSKKSKNEAEIHPWISTKIPRKIPSKVLFKITHVIPLEISSAISFKDSSLSLFSTSSRNITENY